MLKLRLCVLQIHNLVEISTTVKTYKAQNNLDPNWIQMLCENRKTTCEFRGKGHLKKGKKINNKNILKAKDVYLLEG